jgi:hypothetical protein
MKTKKTQTEQVADFIRHAGFITVRQAQRLNINSPHEIIRKTKEQIALSEMYVRSKEGSRFKIFFTNRKAALGYMRKIGGRVA